MATHDKPAACLFLPSCPPACLPPHAAMVALSRQPRFRWAVYDLPQAAPEPAVAGQAAAAQLGWLGHLTWCCPFNPTLEFLDRCVCVVGEEWGSHMDELSDELP